MTYLLALALVGPIGQADSAEDRPSVVVVVGAPGAPEYQERFRDWAGRWASAAAEGGAEFEAIGLDDDESGPEGEADRDRLRAAIGRRSEGASPLWLVLLGHGTFDGREAKFNLRGPDVSDAELAGWLESVGRPTVVVNAASASGPFLNRLSKVGRVIVTATRSGDEQNLARFGEHLSGAIADPSSDLDKDGQVSLLEAFVAAGARTAEWYASRSQLATEHALLDDNGDGKGTPADWFRGVRATRRAADGAPADGPRAHQLYLVPSPRERAIPAEVRRLRDSLELKVAALRDEKATLAEDEYYARLEPLLVELARLYRDLPGGP